MLLPGIVRTKVQRNHVGQCICGWLTLMEVRVLMGLATHIVVLPVLLPHHAAEDKQAQASGSAGARNPAAAARHGSCHGQQGFTACTTHSYSMSSQGNQLVGWLALYYGTELVPAQLGQITSAYIRILKSVCLT